jgi:hypothetical protein
MKVTVNIKEQKEKQEQEARNRKHEEEMRFMVQYTCTEFVDSQNSLRLRLEAERTREEKLQGDLRPNKSVAV